MKDNQDTVQFMETLFTLPCDMYGCYHVSKYDIGKPVDLSNRIRLCESCYEELLVSAPKEEPTRNDALSTLQAFVEAELIGLDELKELVALFEGAVGGDELDNAEITNIPSDVISDDTIESKMVTYTIRELRQLAKDNGIVGHSRKSKEELVKHLQDVDVI